MSHCDQPFAAWNRSLVFFIRPSTWRNKLRKRQEAVEPVENPLPRLLVHRRASSPRLLRRLVAPHRLGNFIRYWSIRIARRSRIVGEDSEARPSGCHFSHHEIHFSFALSLHGDRDHFFRQFSCQARYDSDYGWMETDFLVKRTRNCDGKQSVLFIYLSSLFWTWIGSW